MRIVSGILKSRRINPPANLPVRPTTDMAKEALFNILQNKIYIEDANVLDLFSGTGNMAYEFFSRESESVTAVDQNSRCIRFIKKIKDELEMHSLEVVQADCFSFVKGAYKKYDIIFADPPYDMPNYIEFVELILEKKILTEEGILIVEHSKNTNLSKIQSYTSTRRYGGVHFSFFEA
ncbi:MAG: 16S rRNA (guanine(966)-N(2))-methyltransferase RsmD [Bacteroidetes bacterium]|nr:MAG: 16S rRNA (guanine(966)-N(2))-methyltransferase RsmD [Bacteroidota bacterium]